MQVLSQEQKQAKLKALMESGGFEDELSLLEACVGDSVSPAICVNVGCDYTAQMEPDQREGYCEVCGTQSVQAALVLANMI